MDDFTANASALIEEALGWLRKHYEAFEFTVERDLVWTMQTHLRGLVAERGLPYLVLSDYPMLAGSRRSVFADLVIREKPTGAIVAVEFRYEPEHRRTEFLAMPDKLPVAAWGAEGVAKDMSRSRTFVEQGAATAAFAILIDEGRYFRHRPPHPGSHWVDWDAPASGALAPSVLLFRWPSEPEPESADRADVEPALALADEPARLIHDVALAVEDVDSAEADCSRGVE